MVIHMEIKRCLYCGKDLSIDSTMTMHLKCAQDILASGMRIGEDSIAVSRYYET